MQHYVLSKNPTLVQNAITLAQKKDTELGIKEGLHADNRGHEINNIYTKHNDKTTNIGPCHACNGTHLIGNCNEPICGRCTSNLDTHTPARCLEKHPFSKHQIPSTSRRNDNNNRTKINSYTEPNLQLSILTNKPDIAELLEATRKMKKYILKDHLNI